MATVKDIAIYGAGGLGREIPCVISKINEIDLTWKFIGFFDDGLEKGYMVDGYPVLGNYQDLNNWPSALSVCIGIGSPIVVKGLIDKIFNNNIDFPNIISPDVYFYNKESVKIGRGNFINHNAIISINVQIGNFNMLGANVALGHDSKVGDYNTMMVSSQICGHAFLNTMNFMGIASILLQGLKIDKNVTIGAGSIVMKDTINDATYFGSPARPMIKK